MLKSSPIIRSRGAAMAAMAGLVLFLGGCGAPAAIDTTPGYATRDSGFDSASPVETGLSAPARSLRHGDADDPAASERAMASIPPARIIEPDEALECVPYARMMSDIPLRGDAWVWWQSARDRYRRDRQPDVGSVLVLKRTERLRRGHVAVVSHILSDREILVEHANWLNRGRIHRNTLVRDVSRDNDWSAVRIWYTPGNTLGKNIYPAHGFIHPNRQLSQR